MASIITESGIEENVLQKLRQNGYSILFGPDIAPDGKTPERKSYSEVVLIERLNDAIDRSNPAIPGDAKEEAVKKVLRAESQKLIHNNHLFHKMLVDGVDVQYRRTDGSIKDDTVKLVDFSNLKNNEFLAVNQFTVKENGINKRPDIVLFVNGLPLVVIELKNPAEEKADKATAYAQMQRYLREISTLFHYNEIIIISDGVKAWAGTISSDIERFMEWKAIDGKVLEELDQFSRDTLILDMLRKEVIIDLVRHFITFEKEKSKSSEKIIKKLAAYHQYYAVLAALKSTIEAASPSGDKRAGIIWHTQGSGKSLTMAFYTGKIVDAMGNPTIVVITDRNDLDDQLFETFCKCSELLRNMPKQAATKQALKEFLKVASGGIVFTTAQKFLAEAGEKFPLLSGRRDIVVIADEAHRSQYDFIDGFARHMRDALPNASFIGFTATPIETNDRSTTAVFGGCKDIYDMKQSVNDGMTVQIYYENRLAKIGLKTERMPKIESDFKEITEAEETETKEKLKTKWARMEKVVGAKKRIRHIAEDIVSHFEQRQAALDGKGLIVCMSRRICIDLHDAIVKLRPEWYSKEHDKGAIKVVITGAASDPPEWKEHMRTKLQRKMIENRIKDPGDELKLVIVRDMWLTGFDVPCLHTIYIDKPMKEHGLMQAIARVNRVFKGKPGGLVVDYIGIIQPLKEATLTYTKSGGGGTPVFQQEDAIKIMREKYEIVSSMFHGFDYNDFATAALSKKETILRDAMNHILRQENGQKRFFKNVAALKRTFALSVPHEEAMKIADELEFFQTLKAYLGKLTGSEPGYSEEDYDIPLRQLVSKAIASDKVIDIFEIAGLKKPGISILSDEFLAEVQGMEQKNLALEMLKKLINDQIKVCEQKNKVAAKSFTELLEKTISQYQNRNIQTVEVIERLIELAKEMKKHDKRGELLNLREDEMAFYDALETNDSAVKVLGDETLRKIARELTETLKRNVKIDWSVRESVKAEIRIAVRKILRKYGYPPDKQEKATQTVLEQAELVAKEWSQ